MWSIDSLVFKQIIPLIRLNITLGSLSEADQTKTWHFKYYRLWEGENWGNWRQKQTFPCSSFLRYYASLFNLISLYQVYWLP